MMGFEYSFVTGNCKEVLNDLKNNIKYDSYFDNLNNLIVNPKENSVLISFAIDKPGFIVCGADENGVLRLGPLGLMKYDKLNDAKVKFKGRVFKIKVNKDKPTIDDVSIDTLQSREEALQTVPITSVLELYSNEFENDEKLCGAQASSKLLIKAAKDIINSNNNENITFAILQRTCTFKDTMSYICSNLKPKIHLHIFLREGEYELSQIMWAKSTNVNERLSNDICKALEIKKDVYENPIGPISSSVGSLNGIKNACIAIGVKNLNTPDETVMKKDFIDLKEGILKLIDGGVMC